LIDDVVDQGLMISLLRDGRRPNVDQASPGLTWKSRAERVLKPRRNQALLLCVLLSVHLILGLSHPFTIAADGLEYVVMAQNLAEQGMLTYDGIHPVAGKPPGMPFLISVWLSLVGSLSGFQVFQSLLLFIAYVAVAAIARDLCGPLMSVAVLLTLVLLWPLHTLSAQPISEPAFLMLSSVGLLLMVRALREGAGRYAVLSGVMFGAATYLRPITVFFPIALLAGSFIIWKSRWRTVLVVALVHVGTIAPWTIRNAAEFGQFVPMVANYGPLYYMSDEELWRIYFFQGTHIIRGSDEYQSLTGGEFQFNWSPSMAFLEGALANIKRDPEGYLGRCVRQAVFAWSYLPGTKVHYAGAPLPFALGRGVMVLFYATVLAGAWRLWTIRRDDLFVLAGYWIYTAAVLFPVCTESRYLVPVYIALVALAASGISQFAERVLGLDRWVP